MATIQIGDQCVAVSGTGTSIEIFNDAGTTTLNDAYAVRAERPATSGILLFGREFVLMLVQFVDDNLDMFTDASLPSNTNFMAKADSQQTTFRLRNPDRRFVSLFTADPFSLKPFDHVADIATLKSDVAALNLSADLTQRLRQPLDKASHFLTKGNEKKADKNADKAINELIAFRTLVIDLKGHGLTGGQAQRLTGSVTDIINSFLTC